METVEVMRRGTGGTEEAPAEARFSRTLSSAEVERATNASERASFERWRTSYFSAQAQDDHAKSILREWEARTSEHVKGSPQILLAELARLGFAWRDVAKMVGVSVPAIQKWRRGEGVSGTNHLKVASLVAACDLVNRHAPSIHDVAMWFEVPMLADAPVTPIDLWADARPDLVIAYAIGQEAAVAVLAQWDPAWRDRFASSVRVAVGADSNPILVVGSD